MSGDAPSPDGGAYAAWLAEIERALAAAHRESDEPENVTSPAPTS